jgi:hypothetical protein
MAGQRRLIKFIFWGVLGGDGPSFFFSILGRPPPMCVCVLSLSLTPYLCLSPSKWPDRSLFSVICPSKCFIGCGYNIDTNRLRMKTRKVQSISVHSLKGASIFNIKFGCPKGYLFFESEVCCSISMGGKSNS